MKEIKDEELIRVQSKPETLDKWYEFIKTSAKNLGFGPSVYDNLRPYLREGFELPSVNMGENKIRFDESGRKIYRISMSDRLTINTALLYYNRMRNIGIVDTIKIGALERIFDLVYKYNLAEKYPDKFSSDKDKTVIDIISSIKFYGFSCYGYNRTNERVSTITEYSNKKLYGLCLGDILEASIEDEIREIESIESKLDHIVLKIKETFIDLCSRVLIPNLWFIEVPELEDIYDELQGLITNDHQIINEKYLVLSANPVDKLMASTKQSYGSCLSLCKEGENRGAFGSNIINGTGLFSMIPSESAYIVFMTNGKHKNMYWEEQEWIKSPDMRDSNKAYKYFKYTMRQFYYRCTDINSDSEKEKLLAGRTYFAGLGEVYAMEAITEFMLHKQGIRTGISALFEYVKNMELTGDNNEYHTSKETDLKSKGNLIKPNIALYDMYGNIRAIYMDNVRHNSMNGFKPDTPAYKEAIVTTGKYRTGSYSMGTSRLKAGADAFKLLNGEQDYSYYDKNIFICAECGKVYKDELNNSLKTDNGTICKSCAEEKGYIYCEYCNKWYTEEEKDKHKRINLKDYLSYLTTDNFICKKQLKEIEYIEDNFYKTSRYNEYNSKTRVYRHICPVCGEINEDTWHCNSKEDGMTRFTRPINIDGVLVKSSICSTCLNNAVICEKCGRIVPLGKQNTEPVLLIGTKKVICRHCIDKIRKKVVEKAKLKEDMDLIASVRLTEDTIAEIKSEVDDSEGLCVYDKDRIYYGHYLRPIVKSIYKQESSRLSAGKQEREIVDTVQERILV